MPRTTRCPKVVAHACGGGGRSAVVVGWRPVGERRQLVRGAPVSACPEGARGVVNVAPSAARDALYTRKWSRKMRAPERQVGANTLSTWIAPRSPGKHAAISNGLRRTRERAVASF